MAGCEEDRRARVLGGASESVPPCSSDPPNTRALRSASGPTILLLTVQGPPWKNSGPVLGRQL